MTASKLKQDETRQRRTSLLRLRRQGVPYDDDRILALGYKSSNAARRDLTRALQVHREEEAAEVSIYRQQENERLDELLEGVWERATKPSPVFDKEGNVIDEAIDLRAVDTALRISDRRARLNGLDMPVKAELSGPGGGGVPIGPVGLAELRTLIQTAGDPDEDDEAAMLEGPDGDDTDDDGS